MDRRAHFKRSMLTHCGLAALCVLFCLTSGCQQVAQQPADSGLDPELAELAMSLSAGGEPNSVGAMSADRTEKVDSAEAATVTIEPLAAGKKAAPTAPTAATAAGSEGAAASALKSEPAAVPGGQTAEAPVKKTESAAKSEVAAAVPAQPAEGGTSIPAAPPAEKVLQAAPAETVPKVGEPVKSLGPESLEEVLQPAAEPNSGADTQELTAIIIGGKQIVISEPLPVKNVNLLPDLTAPRSVVDTAPLAAVNPAPPVSEPAGSEGEPPTEDEPGKFRGLLGYGRWAVGYAADHYVVLGSVALAAPAVFVFARRKKSVFRRVFRRMNLDD